MWRRFPFWLLAVTMLAGIDSAPSAQAQSRAKPFQKPEVALPPRRFVEAEVIETVELDGATGAEITPERLERRLAWEIKRLEQVYGLTPEQKKKLEVAGRGDIKRLFERIGEKEETLRRIQEKRARDRDQRDAVRHARVMNEMWALTQEVPVKLFAEGSIFVKILKKTLTPEQRERYEKDQLDFYRARVEWVVVSGLDVLQLSDDQRRRFATRIVQETRPLRRYGQHDFEAVLIQASRLPENSLKPIFDEVQWRRLLLVFGEVRRFESAVVIGGYLPQAEDRPNGDAAAGIREEG